ncbi:MAG: hypothetical protein V1691_02800, partial [Chloroflexota bacterium]
MIRPMASLLKRTVGRIKKMKMFREVSLLFFGILLLFAFQAYIDAYNLTIRGDLSINITLIIVL